MKRRPVFILALLLSLHGCLIPVHARSGDNSNVPGFVMKKSIVIPGLSGSEKSGDVTPLKTTIPMRQIGHLFMIEAKVDDQTGYFLFDTGSQELVLNSTYFRNYISRQKTEGGGFTGTVGQVTRTWVNHIDVAGISSDNLKADVADLGHLENYRGVKIYGLFGFSVFKNMEVVIDVKNSLVKLYRLEGNGIRLDKSDDGFQGDLLQKADLQQNILFIHASVGGKILDFCLDSGAESNALNSTLPQKVMSKVTILRRSLQTDNGSLILQTLSRFFQGGIKIRSWS